MFKRAVSVCLTLLASTGVFAADDAACDRDLGDGRILPQDFRAEDGEVEGGGALLVGGPDGVFEFLYLHCCILAQRSR